MEIVDIILSITTAFFILILFSTLSYEQGYFTFKIDEYKNKMDSADKAFEALLSPGSPEYWYVSPGDAAYLGLLRENYGYEMDKSKLMNLSELCSTNEELLKRKLFVPSDYHLYIKIAKINPSSSPIEICSSPGPSENIFTRETFVLYEGDVASLTMVMWK